MTSDLRENHTRNFALLLLLFFISGATSLAYQVLWTRHLALVFGTSTFAVSTLLASFMAGLAAGGFYMARHADRFARPLKIYGWLEIGIGLYALVLPLLTSAITPLYLDIWRAATPGPVTFGLVQFVLMAAVLLPPTTAMGATLPLLARHVARRPGTEGDRVGTLYSVNTIGAVAGIWVVGFLLLPELGIRGTVLLTAAANLLIGAVALLLPGSGALRSRNHSGQARPVLPGPSTRVAVCIAIGIAGFSALLLEVTWTRLLSLMLGGSAYVFAVILIAFLAGIGLGSKLGGRLADRILADYGRMAVLRAFAGLEAGIAVIAWATMYYYAELPFWYVSLFDWLDAASASESVWWLSLMLAGIVTAPATILMGMRFPMAVRAVIGHGGPVARPVGIVFGANSIGAAVGAFAAGFVLLPALGMQLTVVVAGLCGLLGAGLLLLAARGKSSFARIAWVPAVLSVIAVGIATQRPPWNPLLMTAGMYHYVARFDDHSREGILQQSVDLYDLVFYEEGFSSVVTVGQYKGSEHRWLAINGKVDASTSEDMPTQLLLALLPMQFVGDPKNALVIGLASGITAGVVAQLPGLQRLDAVELEPAIGRAASYFNDWNNHVLEDPRVDLVLNDARNHLLLTEPRSYDLVVSEPSNPWLTGVANLFTRDFFELGKSRLQEGGVWSQWVPVYGMDSRDLHSILQTFSQVFSNVLVYASIDYNDLVLIGSDFPIDPTYVAAQNVLEVSGIESSARLIGIADGIDLLAQYLLDEAGIRSIPGDVPINTDDNLFIEFSTSRKLHVDSRRENFDMLIAQAQVPESAFPHGSHHWRTLARIYQRRGDFRRAAEAAAKALLPSDAAGNRNERGSHAM